MAQILQASVIPIDELESRFGLQEILDNQFFREWQNDLPTINICLTLCYSGKNKEQKHPNLAKTVKFMNTSDVLSILERDPNKVSGAWVFRGTRVPVAAFFENLKDGASVDQFLEWFPGVTRLQVEALLDYELATLTKVV